MQINTLFIERTKTFKISYVFKYFSTFNSVFSKYGSYIIQKSFILPNKFAPVDRPKNYLSDKRSLDVFKEQFNTHYSSNKQVLAELKNGSFEPVSNMNFMVAKSNFITSVPSNSKPLIKDDRTFELLQSECYQHLNKHKFFLVEFKTGLRVEPKLWRYDSYDCQDFKTEVGECLSALDDKDDFIVGLVCHSKSAASFDLNSLGIDITDPMADLVVLATEVNHKSSPYYWKSYPYEEYKLTDQNIIDNFIQFINFKKDKLVFNSNEFKVRSYDFINKILNNSDCTLYSEKDIFVTFDKIVNDLYNFDVFQWNLKNYPYKKPTSVAFEDMDLSLIKLRYQEILDGVYSSNTSASQLLENFTSVCSNSDLQVFCNLAETALSHEFMLALLLPHFLLELTLPDDWTATVYTSYVSLCECGSIKEAFSVFRR